jgi:hypothetical protein
MVLVSLKISPIVLSAAKMVKGSTALLAKKQPPLSRIFFRPSAEATASRANRTKRPQIRFWGLFAIWPAKTRFNGIVGQVWAAGGAGFSAAIRPTVLTAGSASASRAAEGARLASKQAPRTPAPLF